jgi:hypothetical protein
MSSKTDVSSIADNKESDIQKVQDMINSYHNAKLVKPEESPNGNRITHIYSDGSICSTKGGFAYLQRSEFEEMSSFYSSKVNTLVWPIIRGKFGYAIVTSLNALEIRQAMLKMSI